MWVYQGRGFTDYDLKKAIIRACGGKLNGYYTQYRELPLWAVIEAVELVCDIASEES